MFHLIPTKMKKTKLKVEFLYSCLFKSDKGNRILHVVAPTFGTAAAIAYQQSSLWEDSDAFELVSLSLSEVVICKSSCHA